MKPLTFKETALAAGSTSELEGRFDNICTDTRKIAAGCLFVAIKGKNFDGHSFARSALEQGAQAVVCEKDCGLGERQILVNSTERALLDIAGYYRDLFNIPVIGITGSVGKTTTKEMIHAVMSSKYNTLKNEGNLNNEIGVPLTLFRLEKTHEAAVIEMGMSGFSEISRMTRAVKPDLAAITNIGVSHIEKLGSRQGILRAKLEILEGMKEKAPVVLNVDDDMLSAVCPGAHKVLWYGIDKREKCAVKVLKAESRGYETELSISFDGSQTSAILPFLGKHNVYNALAAVTVGGVFGISPVQALEALKNYVPSGMRQKITQKNGIIFIEDCYNASPDSQAAALSVLKSTASKRKIAVIGDMLELGNVSDEAHYTVGQKVAENGIDLLYTYGERSRLVAQGASDSGVGFVKSFENKDELSEALFGTLRQGDAVLFKASRGMKLEDVIFSVYEKLGK